MIEFITEDRRLKTRKGSAIKRSKWGVGKDIGGSLYVHINYVPTEFRDMVDEARMKILISHPTFDPNIVRVDYKKGSVAFYDSPEFDNSNEPAAGEMIVVKDGVVAKPRMVKQIWHHKWLWVGDDYRGFNAEEAFKRSENWLSKDTEDNPLPFAKIGNRQTWKDWLSDNDLKESDQ